MKLTPEQILNFRRLLIGSIGPYAFLMSDDDVQAYRDAIQAKLDEVVKDEVDKGVNACSCDTKRYSYTIRMNGDVQCNHCKKLRSTKDEK